MEAGLPSEWLAFTTLWDLAWKCIKSGIQGKSREEDNISLWRNFPIPNNAFVGNLDQKNTVLLSEIALLRQEKGTDPGNHSHTNAVNDHVCI